MKLNYQILKKLILEQLGTSQAIQQLRDHFYSGDLAAAYDIYRAALNEPDKDISKPIIDYYEDHFMEGLSPLQREALENPEVFITMRGLKSGRDKEGPYLQLNVWTYSPNTRGKMGIPLGTLKVHTDNVHQISGDFLGDPDFNKNNSEIDTDEDFLDKCKDWCGDREVRDWLGEKINEWIRGVGIDQFTKHILNYEEPTK
jgi:hypothetical protein